MNRRELLVGSVGIGALLAGGIAGAAEAEVCTVCKDGGACIKNCTACLEACAKCYSYCLEHAAAGHKDHLKTAALCRDCCDFCELCVRMCRRSSTLCGVCCEACVKACTACADACAKYPDDAVMAACVKACRTCIECCKSCCK